MDRPARCLPLRGLNTATDLRLTKSVNDDWFSASCGTNDHRRVTSHHRLVSSQRENPVRKDYQRVTTEEARRTKRWRQDSPRLLVTCNWAGVVLWKQPGKLRATNGWTDRPSTEEGADRIESWVAYTPETGRGTYGERRTHNWMTLSIWFSIWMSFCSLRQASTASLKFG